MKCTHKRNYSGIPVGIAIRGSIKNEVIFRVRPGNGHFGALSGQVYQDQYTYFVPTSITNAQGQAARDALTQAVANWQGFSAEQKKAYDDEASRLGLRMKGYHLYMREYIRANA